MENRHNISICNYCVTKISIRAKRSISHDFFLFIALVSFFVHCPYKGRINLNLWLLSLFLRMEEKKKSGHYVGHWVLDSPVYIRKLVSKKVLHFHHIAFRKFW